MKGIPDAVRGLLACPRCHAALADGRLPAGEPALECRACGLLFPVEGGIPVLLLERATPVPSK